MKRTFTIFMTLALVLAAYVGQAQRFLAETFSEVQVTRDVTYGVNATVLFFGTAGEAVPQQLKLDVYEPVGDEAEERPLVLVFHTGIFLPAVTNGDILGTKTDSAVVEICNRLAKAGYTAASVDYRTGWNPLAEDQPTRALGLLQATYRGIQDGRTAIRYFKKSHAEDGNPFKVDPNRITAFGVGTGGYLVLGLATLDDYTEIITTTNGPGKFLLSVEPLIPMVVQAYHGDIEGKVLTIAPDAAFGLPAGDTTNYVNHPEYSSDFQLCANVGGALGDISWIDEGGMPIISMQSAFDIFAPYDDATLIVPTTGDPIVRVQGAKAIAIRQNELGNNQVFIDAGINDDFTATAMTNSGNASHDYYEALYPITNPPNSNGLDEGVGINWWDPNAPVPAGLQGAGVPWNMLPHPAGGTFHTQGLALNEDMSAEKARRNIDTVMGYFYPRAFAALDLANWNRIENISPNEVNMQLAPNPVGNEVVLTSAEATPMRAIRIYDINGRLVRSFENVDYHYFFISRGNIPSGTYVVSVEFDNGLASRKVIFE
ncbi:MAG: T9SS type A sorting domain-containing protein [Saprospiraceae bacterium]